MMHFRIALVTLIFVSLNSMAIAKDQGDIECARILNAKDRLACYDKLIPQPPAPRRSYLTLAWNLDKQTEDDRNFNMGRLRTYRQNYFIVTSTNHPNLQPNSPLSDHQVATPFDYDHSEAKFQYQQLIAFPRNRLRTGVYRHVWHRLQQWVKAG
jgi:hypothetical protein